MARWKMPTLGLRGLLMRGGRPSVVEQDLSQARWLYQGYSDAVRRIMRGDFEVAARRDDSVDCFPNSGLVIDDVD